MEGNNYFNDAVKFASFKASLDVVNKMTKFDTYVDAMVKEIKSTTNDEKLEEIYEEVAVRASLEGVEVPSKVTKAIERQSSTVECTVPKYLEGVRFDAYSILPNVKNKQYQENKKIIEKLKSIQGYSPKQIYDEYNKQLVSGNPDRNVLNALEERRLDIRSGARNIANGRYSSKEDRNIAEGKLDMTEDSIRTGFSSNKKIRAKQIDDELDIINFRKREKEIRSSYSLSFHEKIEIVENEYYSLTKDKQKGEYGKYLSIVIKELKEEEEKFKSGVNAFKENEKSKELRKRREQEYAEDLKSIKEKDAQEAAEVRRDEHALEDNGIYDTGRMR